MRQDYFLHCITGHKIPDRPSTKLYFNCDFFFLPCSCQTHIAKLVMASLRCTLSWVRTPLVRPALKTRVACARFHATAIRPNDENLFPDDTAAQDRTIFGAIEALQPAYKQRSDGEKQFKSVLSNKEYKKVRDSLNNSFTVPQLRLYLRQQQRFANKSLRKRDLISHIMHDLWGVKSKDMIAEEERQRRRNDVKHIGRGAKHDLFFLVQDNGEALRQIEQEDQVRITVQFDKLRYVIEGQPDSVEQARQKVEASLVFKHASADIPRLASHLAWPDFTSRISPVVTDISKTCEAYIDLVDQKVSASACCVCAPDPCDSLVPFLGTHSGCHPRRSAYA